MNKNLDYHYFMPITLWIGKYKENDIYHFSDKRGKFWEEWDLSISEYNRMEDIWNVLKIFYVLSFDYYGLYNRGTTIVRMYRNQSFPYETIDIVSNTKRTTQPIYLKFKIFIYPFPDTTLLYISIKRNEIFKVILWDEDTKKDGTLSKRFNFLPTKENKKVVWYKKFNPFLTKFFYVYDFEPTYRFWEENGENICLPSHNPNGYKTLSECIFKNKDSIKNKKVFVQNNSEALHTISITSKYPIRLYQKNIPSILELIFLLFFLIILLYKNK